jgi:hypothetical protein
MFFSSSFEVIFSTKYFYNFDFLTQIMFCAEGDNASEAFRFAQQMDAWLELRRKYQRKNRPLAEWNAPISWTAFYGSAASEIIY